MASTERSWFPPRTRDTNVALIRSVIGARSEADFHRARAAFAEQLHPSLLAELDWMEAQVPPDRRQGAIQHVDGLYFDNLARLVTARVEDLDLGPAEVHQNRDFYGQVLEDPELTPIFGEERLDRIRASFGAERPPLDDRVDPRLAAELARMLDADHLPVLAGVAVSNAVLHHLDHLPSRLRMKVCLRREFDSAVPRLPWSIPADDQVVAEFTAAVEALDDLALRLGFQRLRTVTRTVLDWLGQAEIPPPTQFGGEVHSGVGPCGRCAMNFASAAVLSLDPTSPLTCELDDGMIFVPIFNVARCPWCGHEARIEAPVLFHAPSRNQIVYCAPARDLDEADALEQFRPVLQDLRRRYRARLSDEDAERLDAAGEVITYSVPEFLTVIQLGHAAKEWHAYNVIRFPGGDGMISDPTKNVGIALTEAELLEHWAAAGPQPDSSPPAARDELAAVASIGAGRAAFDEGRFDDALLIFERLVDANPGDTVARTNLATVCLKLGDRDRARSVLTAR